MNPPSRQQTKFVTFVVELSLFYFAVIFFSGDARSRVVHAGQCTLYTWDEPTAEKNFVWSAVGEEATRTADLTKVTAGIGVVMIIITVIEIGQLIYLSTNQSINDPNNHLYLSTVRLKAEELADSAIVFARCLLL